MNERRYMLFYGDAYYPMGGMNDFGGFFATIEAAMRSLAGTECEWAHVYDIEAMKEVARLYAVIDGAGNKKLRFEWRTAISGHTTQG